MTDDLLGEILQQRYVIEAVIARGGMGTVYRARHLGVGRRIAIKVLHDHLVADPEMLARFEREAAITARLHHENLVDVIAIGELPDHRRYIVLELARGEPLTAILERGALPRARMIELLGQILRGLDHAHGACLIHRDLKPDNIVVEAAAPGRSECARIVDFGIALLRDADDSLASARLTATGVIMGTPQYMAPEQALGHALDPRTDLFALGVIAYQMATGMLPFDATGIEAALANVARPAPSFAARGGQLADPLIEGFVQRLLARRRDDRFADAREALAALAVIAQGDVVALPAPPPRRGFFATRRLRRSA